MRFIDIHCHILPGIDDGPEYMKTSLEMIKMAIDDGISHIFATPHIMDGVYDNNARKILNTLDNLKSCVSGPITMFHGADVRLTPDMIMRIENGDIPTLNNSGYLLIELPLYVIPPHMDSMIFNLLQRGITPVITHPERHMLLKNDFSELFNFRKIGAMLQITAMSITGDFGKDIRKACFAMIEKGLADIVASDAHNLTERPPVLSRAYGEVKKHFGCEIADGMFFYNPDKIVKAGEDRCVTAET